MKKQVLLLIPAALLALTACDNQGSQPSGSEGPHFPSVDEIIEALQTNSFTLDVKDDYYDQGTNEKDTIRYRFLKDGLRLEYQSYDESARPGDEYITEHFYDVTDPREVIEYYQFNSFWLTHDLEEYEDIEAYTIIQETFEMIVRPEAGVQVEWQIGDGVIEGNVVVDADTAHITIQLNEVFFSELKIERVINDKNVPFCWDTTLTITKYGQTEVTFPATPAQDLYNKLEDVHTAVLALNSYTLHGYVTVGVEPGITVLGDVTYEVMMLENGEVYKETNGQNVSYFIHEETPDGDIYEEYDVNSVTPVWVDIDEETFFDEVRMALLAKDFEEYPTVEDLAIDLIGIEEASDTKLAFSLLKGNGIHEQIEVVLNNNVPTTMKNILEDNEVLVTVDYTISAVNSTSFEYPNR